MSTLHTPLCDLLNIELPIIQAPIGPAAGPALAAAVSNAGGLGSIHGRYRVGRCRTGARDSQAN